MECASAICRLEREDALEPAVAEVVNHRLGQLCLGWNEMEARAPVREMALRLLRLQSPISKLSQLGDAFPVR